MSLHQPFQRVAIVNRGEPAMRFIRAARSWSRRRGLPLDVVALWTQPDRHARFVQEADASVPLGPALVPGPDGKPRSAYVDVERIVRLVSDAGCDAVWPGWGFVSENAAFSDALAHAGIVFIGPSGDAMRRLGDKIGGKLLAERESVPVMPWSGGPVASAGEAREAARRLGFPVLIKASAGGGGRGIRVVREESAVEAAFVSAVAEASAAFGDGTVFIEKLEPAARHVEVQVIADSHGHVFALGTRDCSLQRRHQKVVEEAPAPGLTPESTQALCDAAIRVARAAGYVNAGTCEFLVRPDGTFAFLEMNARLQVEHTVTEQVTGLDLVGLQLDVASGRALELGPVVTQGHAIEVRLCAEDPDAGFTPVAGRLARWEPPHGPGVRVDSGVSEGAEIPSEFDSMLAKVIATGATRDEALARLEDALDRFVVAIEGGPSNRSLLLELVRHPRFRDGPVTTDWLDRWLVDRPSGDTRPGLDTALAAAAIGEYVGQRRGQVLNFLREAQRGLPQGIPDPEAREFRFRVGRRPTVLSVAGIAPRTYRVTSGGRSVEASFEFTGQGTGVMTLDGRRHDVVRIVTPSTVFVELDGVSHRLLRASDGRVTAPVPAAVTAVHVKPGQSVKAGDRLVTLEVMKMEVGVEAPDAGRVTALHVGPASRVAAGDALCSLEASGEGDQDRAEFPAFPNRPEAPAFDAWSVVRGAVLGYEHPVADVDAAIAALRAGTVHPTRDEVLALIGAATARERLFSHEVGTDGVAPVDHLASLLRVPRSRGEGLPARFLTELRDALAAYDVFDLAAGPVLESALLRLFQAHRAQDDRDPVLLAALAALERIAESEAPEQDLERHRAGLEEFATQAAGRNKRLAEQAWLAVYALCDRPRQLREGEILTTMAGEALASLADKFAAAAETLLDSMPLGALLAHAGELPGPDAARRRALDLFLMRFRPGAERSGDIEGRLAATYRTPAGALLGLVTTVPALASELVGHTQVSAVEAFVPEPLPDAIEGLEARLEEVVPAWDESGPRRVSITWGDVRRGRLGRTYIRDGAGWHEDPFFRDFHPERVEASELQRFSAFSLERVPGDDEIFVAHARARQDGSDERLFCLMEVERVDFEHDASGAVVRSPSFERAFLSALRAMRRPVRERKLFWNRLVVFVRPPLELGREEFANIAARLAAPTAGLALEKVALHVTLPDGNGGFRQTAIEWSNPTGTGVALTILDAPKTAPLRTLSAYDRAVIEARRRGQLHPYELVRALSGTASDGPFPPGTFVEHDLDATGDVLVPVDRPYGQNVANLVVGVVTNHLPAFEDGLTRVLIVGDPTRGMGALAEPECRRILAAFALAEARGLPVEWVPVSSGAKIAFDSGTENLDWTARVLARIVRFTTAGGTCHVIVDGVCVGAQSYWNAEATMLLHCRGALVMTPGGAMLLTGKKALEFAGSVAAEDNAGIGGYARIMGPNGEAQYFAPDLVSAYALLFRHYRFNHVRPGEQAPRALPVTDPIDRDATSEPYDDGAEPFRTVGEIFAEATNPGRKRPFGIRAVMRAVLDHDHEPLERWQGWQGAESAVTWEGSLGGTAVTCIGIESRPTRRRGDLRSDGPDQWTSGTLFPASSKKVARAIRTASGVKPVVVLANLSGFDGSPDSLRNLQLEYGAEIGRAVVEFRGKFVFCVVSRYHGGAYVVFSRALNDSLEAVALEGTYASVIGGAPAAAVVFPGLVRKRVAADPAVVAAKRALEQGSAADRAAAAVTYEQVHREATARAQAAVAREFDAVHSIERAHAVGSLDAILPARSLRSELFRRVSGQPIR